MKIVVNETSDGVNHHIPLQVAVVADGRSDSKLQGKETVQ